jgi:hypothetical protein
MFIVSLSNDATFQSKSRVDGSKSSSSCLLCAGIIEMLVFVEFMNELLNFVNMISLKTILTFPDELISVILPEQA